MKTNWNWVQTIFASLGGFFGWFFGVGSPGGSFDGFLYALLVFVVVDYLTGVMCAIADKKLSSEVGFKGICKKVLIFVMVGVAHIMDIYLIGNGEVLRTAVIFFYCSNARVCPCWKTRRIWGCPFLKNSRRLWSSFTGGAMIRQGRVTAYD